MKKPDLPHVVYHYTAMNTLLKIVESESWWATHIGYLNDVKERQLFVDAVTKRAEAFNGPTDAAIDPSVFSRFFEDEAEGADIDRLPYVVSFSKHDDSLPQWRAYCPNGNGVCIGFSTSHLNLLAAGSIESVFDVNVPQVTFAPVEYVDDLDNERFDDIVVEEITTIKQQLKESPVVGLKLSVAENLAYRLRDRATFIKHNSFSAEGEYRLLISFMTGMAVQDSVRVRSSRTTLIPFVNVPFPQVNEDQDYWPIVSVRVGPTPNPQLSVSALRLFLSSKHINAEVEASRSPFRDL